MTSKKLSILLFVALLLFGTAPLHAQERCTTLPGRDNSCFEYSTCNTSTGKCDYNQNVPVGGACIQDSQCVSGQCFDLECKPADYVPSVASGDSEDRLINLLSVDSAQELVVKIIDLMIQVGSILLIFALVMAGFKFVSAQGNPGSIEEARKSLTWVVIGGMLLLGAQAISLVIKATIESL